MTVYCGIDWAEKHHDIALVDADGQLVAKRRIKETVEGFAELTAMLAEAGDNDEDPIPVAIETPRGLLVAALRATGRRVYPINPMAVLAEIGDDRARFADARSLKAYAGSAPVTRASGRSLSITHRRVKNDRLAAAGFVWAFVAAAHSPGANALYYRRREHGDRHAAAPRNVFNRLIGCLYHCLQTGQAYDETKAFPTQTATPEPAAA